MIASSEQERHAWKDAITNNIDAYKVYKLYTSILLVIYLSSKQAHMFWSFVNLYHSLI